MEVTGLGIEFWIPALAGVTDAHRSPATRLLGEYRVSAPWNKRARNKI
ncbi:MAG: hypothetical protein BIP78_1136 [Candidatus Bipolaricaulis sibiricus]|uniref:Uncharacterized protein n=1 Tax=Bipolaricaulis sibiricus TaxID=2501609 RepID=A0A410FV99_BIPS1|nr:MAG: hypothetical protein BIP78_1136 [Candidatus Bipolaricaulis sibiricus]